MDNIDFLEHGSPILAVRFGGEVYELKDPRSMHFQEVLVALRAEVVPGAPSAALLWQHALLFDRWRAGWGLCRFDEARRLTYLLDNYRPQLVADLAFSAPAVDLGESWRARRWQHLLDVIDRLPAHTWYSSAIAEDEEHATMLAQSIVEAREAGTDDDRASGPSLVGWTPEVAALHNIIDAVRGVQHAVVAVQAGSSAGPPPDPMPRPATALDRAIKAAEFKRRQTKHESLVARVLPHKSRDAGPLH